MTTMFLQGTRTVSDFAGTVEQCFGGARATKSTSARENVNLRTDFAALKKGDLRRFEGAATDSSTFIGRPRVRCVKQVGEHYVIQKCCVLQIFL